MTTRDIIRRRIYLKEQLIVLVRREIEALEKSLRDLGDEKEVMQLGKDDIRQSEGPRTLSEP